MNTNKIFNLMMAFVFAFSLSGMPVPVSAQEPQPNPIIKADLTRDIVQVYGWPNGTPLTLTIGTETFEATVGNPNEFVAQFYLEGFDLLPGQLITVTDNGNPAVVHTYTTTAVIITGFNPTANTISGTATPGANVRVRFRVSGSWVERNATADGYGDWTVDYSGIGVILGSTRIAAFEDDADGDSTIFNWRNPYFWVWRDYHAGVETLDWPLGVGVTLTIDDPGTPANPDYGPFTETTEMAPWPDSNQTYAGFDFTFDIQPGYVISITDGVMTRTHTITSLEITEVNPDTNIVSGIAAPNSQVEINVSGETDFQETTADGYGDWSIDFTDIYDIGPDSWVQSRQEDNDGDYTLDGLAHNCYYVTVSTDPSGGGSVDVPPERCAGGYHLGRVAELTATAAPGYVFAGWSGDASGMDNPLLVTMDADKTVTANFIQNEYTLNVISAHGTVAKNPNQATYHEGDVVQLTATPNVGWYFAKWTGDLMSNVNPDSITIHGNTTVTANYTRPMFWVWTNGIWPNDDAFIETIKWPLGVEVTLTIDDPVTPESPDYGPFTEITGIDPWGHSYASARFDFTFDILPGYVISISDGVITKTHTVTSLEVTDVNPNTNIVTGVAAPYSQVEIDEPDFQEVIADGNGNWSIDFSDIYDIVPETFVEAMQWDNDDDLTMAGKYAFEHNQPPIANAGGAYSGYAGSIIELNASASSDPDGDALTYEWDLDNDGQYDDASGVTVATSFSQVGNHIVGLRVTDDGGLSDTDITTVTILPWTLKGFYQPVDMNGVYNTVKGGSTVPLKFEIFAVSTELTDIASVRSLTYAQTSCDTSAITDEIETTATGNTSLRYADGQFIYNWKTPKNAGKCYRVTMTTIDGSSLVAYFKLK